MIDSRQKPDIPERNGCQTYKDGGTIRFAIGTVHSFWVTRQVALGFVRRVRRVRSVQFRTTHLTGSKDSHSVLGANYLWHGMPTASQNVVLFPSFPATADRCPLPES